MMSKENIATLYLLFLYCNDKKRQNVLSTKLHEMFARIIQNKDGNNGKQ